MPKISKQSAETKDYGPVEEEAGDLEGYTVNFVRFKERLDHTQMFESLPGGRCQCPHWGYVLSGSLTVRYEQGDEVLDAGDAFYMTPGHIPVFEAGTEVLLFSPAEEFKATDAVIMQAMQGS